jgi:hypothetical protein
MTEAYGGVGAGREVTHPRVTGRFFFRTSPFQLPGARSGAPEMNDADLELPDEEHVGLSSGKSAERGLA